jgi:hypothetical protein
MPKSPSPQLVKTAEELRLDEARENGVPWKQWGRHGDCRPVSSIDLNNLPPNHRFKASVEREETEAERNVRLGKEVVVFALAAAFVSAIYYLAFVTATSPTATPEEKKWAMSVLSAGAAGLVGYLVRK